MKLAYCFVASAALHAALFTIPSFSPENAEEKIIPVRVVVGKREEVKPNGDQAKPLREGDNPRHLRARVKPANPAPPPAEEKKISAVAAPTPLPAPASMLADAAVSKTLAAVPAEQTGVASYALRASSGGSAASGGPGESRNGGAAASGAGKETGNAASPEMYAQASYAENPIPEYPERARRQGWEGTVLLNVLVSAEGKPQKIEIKQSSGFEILDRAATTAVKGWRFHPARYGATAFESWVKIPILFRLSDEKN